MTKKKNNMATLILRFCLSLVTGFLPSSIGTISVEPEIKIKPSKNIFTYKLFLGFLKFNTMKKSIQFFINSFLLIISIALKIFLQAFLLLKDKLILSAGMDSNGSIDIN